METIFPTLGKLVKHISPWNISALDPEEVKLEVGKEIIFIE